MTEQTNGYFVYLYEQAVEALGEAVKPYLHEGAGGPHILCREVDTGGAFVEMSLPAPEGTSRGSEIELMIPMQMVRMIVSTHSEAAFGFSARNLEPGLAALPVVGPDAPAPREPSTAMPQSAAAGAAAADDHLQPPEG